MNPPQIPCVCCGEILEAKYQPSMIPTRPGYWLVTCLQDDCPMNGFTLADVNYPPQDLAPYLESGCKRLDLQKQVRI